MPLTFLTFQFHKGTIKTGADGVKCRPFLDFNSIKVRLKPHGSGTSLERVAFQFHKGTIKTLKMSMTGLLLTLFQFHKGTIKTGLFKSQSHYYDISIP